MSERWITVATFATPEQAHIVRTALGEAGLPARIDDDVIVGLAWYLGTALGGVKVKVPEEYEAAARDFLEQPAEGQEATAGEEFDSAARRRQRPAACSACGERTQAGFDLCWNCGAELAAELASNAPSPVTLTVDAEVSTAEPTELASDTVDDPEPSPDEDQPSPRPPTAAELTDRAFKAAVIGCIVCPGFLQVYSVWNLLKAAAIEEPDDRTSSVKWYGALLINLAVLGYVAILLRFMVAWGMPPVDDFLF